MNKQLFTSLVILFMPKFEKEKFKRNTKRILYSVIFCIIFDLLEIYFHVKDFLSVETEEAALKHWMILFLILNIVCKVILSGALYLNHSLYRDDRKKRKAQKNMV